MNYKILIIDDEPMVIEGLKKLVPWEEINCEIVATAKNGEEGLISIEDTKPDIVISDIRMPKLSGLEMIKALKEKKGDIKFILLTGYREFEYAREAINLGVIKFLLKPTNLEDIKNAVVEATSLLDEERSKDEDLQELRIKLEHYLDKVGESEEEIPLEEKSEMNYLTVQAISFMKENFRKKLDLQTVADALYISPWYLCKILKKEVGNSFVQLLNELRIQEAKRLLMQSNNKIYEICEMIGFIDVPYFTKIFKKHTNMTPNKFRNTYYEGNDQHLQH